MIKVKNHILYFRMNNSIVKNKRRKLNRLVDSHLNIECELSCHSSNSTESVTYGLDNVIGIDTGISDNISFSCAVQAEKFQCSE